MLRCNKCYHDTLFIEMGFDNIYYIKCSNCKTTITMQEVVTPTEELILYNINMSEAYAEGKRDFIDGKEMKDNPYSSSSEYQDSSVWWVKGWTEEKQAMSGVSTFLSAKKELDGELEDITEKLKTLASQYENLEKLSNKNEKNYNTISDLCSLIVKLLDELKAKNYWFGGAYKKDVNDIMRAIVDFCDKRDFTL